MKKSNKIIAIISLFILLVGTILSPITYARTNIFMKKEEKREPINVFKTIEKKGIESISKFDLREEIPENVQLKDQKTSNICWSFALNKCLETNLALQDKRNGKKRKTPYDFSEIHMAAGTSERFAGGEKNPYGTTYKKINDGATDLQGISYLVSGLGPVDETDMPFDNYYQEGAGNGEVIKTPTLEEMRKLKPKARVYDTKEFYADIWNNKPDASPERKEQRLKDIKTVKEHIYNHGAIYGIIDTSKESDCINKATNAIYSKSNNPISPHAVAIIGWDDNYSKSNFKEKPGEDGAWIAINSYGKQNNKNDDTDPAEIYYISYNHSLATPLGKGIIKASSDLGYDNLYQYDLLGVTADYISNVNQLYIGTKFPKKTQGKEYLNEVMVYSPGGNGKSADFTYEVYINPTSDNIDLKQCKKVSLKTGENQTCQPGYHTFELATPVELTGNGYAVILKVTGNEKVRVGVECEASGEYEGIKIESGKCFISESASGNNWQDLSKKEVSQKATGEKVIGGDLTIKAYTTTKPKTDDKITELKIVKPPIKTLYTIGHDFNPTGMEVEAYYNDKEKAPIKLKDTDYEILDGNDLQKGKEFVTISYKGLTVKQPIEVKKAINLKVTKQPNKTVYNVGDKFEYAGMEVMLEFDDNTEALIKDYKIYNGNQLKEGQNEIQVGYDNFKVSVKIKVNGSNNPDPEIPPINPDPEIPPINPDPEIPPINPDPEIPPVNPDPEIPPINPDPEIPPINPDPEIPKIINIEIAEKPNKLKYIKDKEELDLTGGKVNIIYNNGTYKTMKMTDSRLNIKGFDNRRLGVQKINIEYNNFNVSFEIEIVNPPEANIIKNSDLSNIKNTTKRIRTYLYTDDINKNFTLIDTEISGIKTNKYHDELDYYYYISDKNNETHITDWIKITENQKENGKLKFQIDSRKIKNIDKIENGKNVYIYIKEIARKSANQVIEESKAIKLDVTKTAEVYKDGVRVEDLDFEKENGVEPEKNNNSNTIIPNQLPFAGTFSTILILIILSVISMMLYKKYNKYKRI